MLKAVDGVAFCCPDDVMVQPRFCHSWMIHIFSCALYVIMITAYVQKIRNTVSISFFFMHLFMAKKHFANFFLESRVRTKPLLSLLSSTVV